MNYSSRRKQSKELIKLQELQTKILKEARIAKQEANTHEERLKIEAQTRTLLNKTIEAKNKSASGQDENVEPVKKIEAQTRTHVDLNSEEDLGLAMEEILKAQA